MIHIGKRIIGEGNPCYIIAELGVNHNGDLDLAKKMIDTAKKCGADAVKFQSWITEETIAKGTALPKYMKATGCDGQTQYEMAQQWEFSHRDFQLLAQYAKKTGIDFLSTPEGKTCIDWLEQIGVIAYKIASPDIINHPDIEYIAKTGKPIILSTGMATLDEIQSAVSLIKKMGNKNIILLHCTSNYPTRLDDVNLNAMVTLKKKFRTLIGYSDHTPGDMVPAVAVALGACIIEKHFTLDKTLPGPDHKASLEPDEFEEMVKKIRLVEKILGSYVKAPLPSETEMLTLTRKFILANKKILKGQVISGEDIAIKRTTNGIHYPTQGNLKKIIGKKAKQDYTIDEPI